MKLIEQITSKDIPSLAACGGIFSYCTLANITTVMQQVGIIASSLAAIVILVHRIWLWKNRNKK